MDPVTIVLTALATGATTTIKDTTSQAIKDAYTGLKTLIQQRFANSPQAKLALTEYEKDADIWEKPLQKLLVETAVDRDEEIIHQAQQLLKLINPQQASQGKYNVQITGNVQGFAQGDHQQVTMHFDNPPKEHE